MKMPTRPLLTAFFLWLSVLLHAGAAAQDGGYGGLPPTLVNAAVLESKVTEAEADPGLEGEEKTKLVALYREALSNLKEADANGARAAAFEEATGTALEQTQRIRARMGALGSVDPPDTLAIDPETPRGRIERRLEEEQAALAAADARRADFERQLAYQENRPATIRQRLAAAEEQQEAIDTSLQAELADNEDLSMVQARRWGLETRYVALSNEIKALDQELLSLPMRLELLAAKRDEEEANAEPRVWVSFCSSTASPYRMSSSTPVRPSFARRRSQRSM